MLQHSGQGHPANEQPGFMDGGRLDNLVRARLKQWPQRPPGIAPTKGRENAWLRGRPGESCGSHFPFLKLPGSTRLRTLPDGLWLNFGGSPAEPFVDIFGIM